MHPSKINSKQIEKLRRTWQRISRLGLALYVFAFGSALLLWMVLCFVGFMYLDGRQHLLHDSFLLESTLPCMAFVSYILPVIHFFMLRAMMRKLDLSPQPTA